MYFNFCPKCTRSRGFSRHSFPARFVGFLFSYFCRFLLFSLFLHENVGHLVNENCQIVDED